MAGRPIEVRFIRKPRDRRGDVLGGALLRERRIILDAALRRQPAELARILIHEIFHFAWVRLGNPMRRAWEDLLKGEIRARVRGELGWSAEWRKAALEQRDSLRRTRRWREYCCESFCDTAAWIFAGIRQHEEFTLPARACAARRKWFTGKGVATRISI
jgi:hypothetical protein